MKPTEAIDRLVHDGIVDEVVTRVKTGKEAEVFVVRKGTDYLAAKVYKERHARNFRNNAGYREGRSVRNTRDARAMAKGTKYGTEKAESEWMHTEHDALVTLVAAGVRVPKAELFYEGVLLMELVLGSDGQPAPRLIEVPLSPEEAIAQHRDLIGMIVKMLCCDLIHGDLSPYNILMAWNGPTIIDLPQVVKAAHNNSAEEYLVRDVRNVTEYFARAAPDLKKRLHDGYAIWKKYMARELAPDYFPEEGTVAPPREFAPRGDPAKRPEGRVEGRPAGRPHDRGPRPPGRPPGPAHRSQDQRPVTTPHEPNPPPRPHEARPAPQGSRPQGQGPQGPRPQGQGPQGPRPQGQGPQGPRPQGQGPRPQGAPHHARPQGQGAPRPQGAPHAGRPPQGPRPQGPANGSGHGHGSGHGQPGGQAGQGGHARGGGSHGGGSHGGQHRSGPAGGGAPQGGAGTREGPGTSGFTNRRRH